jgi:hypothetical protein
MMLELLQGIVGILCAILCVWYARRAPGESASSHMPKLLAARVYLRANLPLSFFGALAVTSVMGSWFMYVELREPPPAASNTGVAIKYVSVPDPQQTALIETLKQQLSEAERRIDWLNTQLKDPPIKANEPGTQAVMLINKQNRPRLFNRMLLHL